MSDLPPVDPGEALGASARQATRGVLGPAVAKAATIAVAQAQRVQAATYARTVVADFAAVRRNAELVAATAASLSSARTQVVELITAALEAGYRATAEAKAHLVGLSFTWGPEDRAVIDAFPVVDHTATEHADMLIAGLSFDVNGATARVLAGGLPADQLSTKLDQLAETFSQRVGALVADAWYAGASAAQHTMAAALSSPV